MSENDITTSIEANAEGPKKVTVDGMSVEQHSIQDQIEADRYLKSQNAAAGANRGIRFSQFRNQGTTR